VNYIDFTTHCATIKKKPLLILASLRNHELGWICKWLVANLLQTDFFFFNCRFWQHTETQTNRKETFFTYWDVISEFISCQNTCKQLTTFELNLRNLGFLSRLDYTLVFLEYFLILLGILFLTFRNKVLVYFWKERNAWGEISISKC
jgi:hypothetical protein